MRPDKRAESKSEHSGVGLQWSGGCLTVILLALFGALLSKVLRLFGSKPKASRRYQSAIGDRRNDHFDDRRGDRRNDRPNDHHDDHFGAGGDDYFDDRRGDRRNDHFGNRPDAHAGGQPGDRADGRLNNRLSNTFANSPANSPGNRVGGHQLVLAQQNQLDDLLQHNDRQNQQPGNEGRRLSGGGPQLTPPRHHQDFEAQLLGPNGGQQRRSAAIQAQEAQRRSAAIQAREMQQLELHNTHNHLWPSHQPAQQQQQQQIEAEDNEPDRFNVLEDAFVLKLRTRNPPVPFATIARVIGRDPTVVKRRFQTVDGFPREFKNRILNFMAERPNEAGKSHVITLNRRRDIADYDGITNFMRLTDEVIQTYPFILDRA